MPPGIGYGGYEPLGPAEQGLGFRMLEHLPGVSASLMFAQGRGANTIMAGGGFMDFEKSRFSRARRHRIIDAQGRLTGRDPGQYLGKARGAKLANQAYDGKNPLKINFLRSSRVNHLTMNPRAATKYHSLSIFSNAQMTGAYTPFAQISLGLGRTQTAINQVQKFVGGAHTVSAETLGPGLFSAISASSRMDRLEAKAVKRGTINPRLERKLAKADRSIEALMRMNTTLMDPGQTGTGRFKAGHKMTVRDYYANDIFYDEKGRAYSKKGARIRYYDPVTGEAKQLAVAKTKKGLMIRTPEVLDAMPEGSFRGGTVGMRDRRPRAPQKLVGRMPRGGVYTVGDEVMRSTASVYSGVRGGMIGAGGAMTPAQIGMRGDLLVSALPGVTTQFAGGYVRTAMGKGQHLISQSAIDGRTKAYDAIRSVLGGEGVSDDVVEKILLAKSKGGAGFAAGFKAQGVTMRTVMQNTAARNVAIARVGGNALAGLNALGTAALAYDLGKMAGEVVVSGINLARDAYKSVQGSINKPAFGMGYQDTEAAATSRARGVMAIQNSRLNARSVLGSEAGMLAAHFG